MPNALVMRHAYIAIEGLIGAGKTTLATLLAKHIDAELVLEEFDNNEFLTDFYTSGSRWALPMQLWFLATRTEQQRKLSSILNRTVISDYTFSKDAAFAQALLAADRELNLYRRIADSMQSALRKPDVVIYLDASNELLLERIHRRNRSYERYIDASYLNSLRATYDTLFGTTGNCSTIRIDPSTRQLTSSNAIAALVDEIAALLPSNVSALKLSA